MFDLSYFDLLVVITAGVVVLGPKDVPVVARAAGRMAGRAVGYGMQFRDKAAAATKGTDLQKLHSDLQTGLSEMQAIQTELRHGFSITRPGPIAQRVLQQLPGDAGLGHAAGDGGGGELAGGRAGAGGVSTPPTGGPAEVPSQPREPRSSSSSLLPQAAQAALSAGGGGGGGNTGTGIAPGASGMARLGGFEYIPISAVSVGAAPSRADGPTATGADIVSDAVLEQRAAEQAAGFLSGAVSEEQLRKAGLP